VKREDNVQGDSSLNNLQNVVFIVSSLVQVERANDSARPVRPSYLYDFLGRDKCN